MQYSSRTYWRKREEVEGGEFKKKGTARREEKKVLRREERDLTCPQAAEQSLRG